MGLFAITGGVRQRKTGPICREIPPHVAKSAHIGRLFRHRRPCFPGAFARGHGDFDGSARSSLVERLLLWDNSNHTHSGGVIEQRYTPSDIVEIYRTIYWPCVKQCYTWHIHCLTSQFSATVDRWKSICLERGQSHTMRPGGRLHCY